MVDTQLFSLLSWDDDPTLKGGDFPKYVVLVYRT